MKIKILSYNIHKGFTLGNRKFILDKIKDSIKMVEPDIVCLQEIMGETKSSKKHPNWVSNPQFEFLADKVWQHCAYEKNAINSYGNHGNAILSKYQLTKSSNTDISSSALEKRGVLYTKLLIPNTNGIHLFCTHLSLLKKDRIKQISQIKQIIKTHCKANEPIIFAGDFNDWDLAVHNELTKIGFQESFNTLFKSLPKTFPSSHPFLKLDRVYFKNLKTISALALSGPPWNKLSDHLAILVEFEL